LATTSPGRFPPTTDPKLVFSCFFVYPTIEFFLVCSRVVSQSPFPPFSPLSVLAPAGTLGERFLLRFQPFPPWVAIPRPTNELDTCPYLFFWLGCFLWPATPTRSPRQQLFFFGRQVMPCSGFSRFFSVPPSLFCQYPPRAPFVWPQFANQPKPIFHNSCFFGRMLPFPWCLFFASPPIS